MKRDPYPQSSDPQTEARFRVIFEESNLDTQEPERNGLYFDEQSKKLKVKLNGRIYTFTPEP